MGLGTLGGWQDRLKKSSRFFLHSEIQVLDSGLKPLQAADADRRYDAPYGETLLGRSVSGL